MRITPIDIETRRFPMKFRGFHPEEVSTFLEQIREELEDLLRENAALKEQIHKADAEIQRFWEMQDLLSRTVQDAHQISEEFKVHARREADSLLEKAEEAGRDMVKEAHDKALQINEEIIELKMMRREFDDGMRNILSRFDNVIAGGNVFREEISLHEAVSAAESGHERTSAAEAGALLLTEDQIHVIEGHQGEEGSSETEQY
ncbi:MAG: DivIVA domain-containing protein [Nitrospirae bacterium]|nr:DivIVA domain-containing protein [Nitrospirota bacterium]